MGNPNSVPSSSYLLKGECSARNITWHYLKSHGNLAAPYADCSDTDKILHKHCCREGECHPVSEKLNVIHERGIEKGIAELTCK